MRERISFLFFGDRECVLKTASQTNDANQTEGILSGMNKCQNYEQANSISKGDNSCNVRSLVLYMGRSWQLYTEIL